MFRKFVLIILVFSFAGYAFAVDVVRLKNGKQYEGTVVAINPKTVDMISEDGKLKRTILKKEISIIEYENGKQETFPEFGSKCGDWHYSKKGWKHRLKYANCHCHPCPSCCILLIAIPLAAIAVHND